nr:hypothetical protein [Kibdelosporangium sp. MJ126-NF4]CTQ89086.1 hypothetical protein [Kibdelosporangium sp. MJ126-NF4]
MRRRRKKSPRTDVAVHELLILAVLVLSLAIQAHRHGLI